MPVLVVGTRNVKKRRELLQTLAGIDVEIRDLTAYPDAPEVVEGVESFVANAEKKAVELALALGEFVLGEDSGLCVPALGGAPGVISAHYAGTHGDDAANNRKLVAELGAIPPERREAYYVCVAVLADPAGKVVGKVEGRCHGRMVLEARGEGGFGYDPYFEIPEYHRTFGELSATVKNALSHRGKAMAALRPVLRSALAGRRMND